MIPADQAKQFFTLGWEDCFEGKPMVTDIPEVSDIEAAAFLAAALKIYQHGYEAAQSIKHLFVDGPVQ